MAIRVLEETGLLPHLNPGVLTWRDFQRLKPVAPSMGMMLETTATRACSTEKGGAALRLAGQGPGRPAARAGGRRAVQRAVHHRHPDRDRRDRPTSGPSRSSRIRRGGAANTAASRRSSSRTSGPSPTRRCAACPTPTCRSWPPPSRSTRPGAGPAHAGAGPAQPDRRRIRPDDPRGHRRLGRRLPLTPDHVNPERPWPQIDALARHRPRQPASTLRERLTIYPEYVRAGEPWLDPRLLAARVRAGRPDDGLARRRAARRAAWQEPDGGFAAVGPASTCTPRSTPRAARPTGAATSTTSTATGTPCEGPPRRQPAVADRRGDGAEALPPAPRRRPAGADRRRQAVALLSLTGDAASTRCARPGRRRAPRGRSATT